MPKLIQTSALCSPPTSYNAPVGEEAAQDPRGPGHVSNAVLPIPGGASVPDFVLSEEEAAVRAAILRSHAPESWKLAGVMDHYLATAETQEDRDAVLQRMKSALEARGEDVAALQRLGLNVMDTVLNRAAWSTLLAALPSWASSAMTAGQVARGAFTGSWSNLAAVLPSLAAGLPSLRNHAEFEALVQSLPEAIRTGLSSLHESIADTDAQLRPNLAGGRLLPALAVAALLWQVQRSLPSPTRQLQGVGRFIAELPNHWQRIAVVNGVGGALLSPVAAVSPDNAHDTKARKHRPGPAEKEQRIEFQRWADQALRPGPQRIRPTIDSLDAIPFDAATVPGGAHAGGVISEAPSVQASRTEPDAATSPGTRQQAGWFSWLVSSLPLLKGAHSGFERVAETSMEMAPMGKSLASDAALREVTSTTPLVPPEATIAATAAPQAVSRLRRSHMAAAVIGVLGGATGAAIVARNWLWPAAPAAATPAELAAQLSGEVVELPNGNWGNGLDLLLGELEAAPQSGRVRRAAPEATTAPRPDAAADITQLHGISAEQLEALRADPMLLQQVESMRRWSVAVARDIATHAGWEWVEKLPASEQELLVGQWQALRELRPALAAVEDSTDRALREALRKTGFNGDWQKVEVQLPSTEVAGIEVDHRLPLLEYLLMRNALGTPSFLRGDVPVSAAELAQLTRFVGSADARRLQGDINARVEQLRPALGRALQARLVIDALKAKATGVLGSGNAHQRGADVVLGFLQGTGAVERATLTYTDRLPNGAPITVPVPNYLVLRSAGEAGLNGQVVLYRSDLSSFQAFGDEGAFRQFLDTQRARTGMFAADGGVDSALAGDIVQAAAPAQRTAVRGLVQAWEARLARYQSGDRSAKGWNPADSFQLDFARVDSPEGARQQWADALITHGQAVAQQRLDRNLLRWSPLGIANVAAENEYRLQQDTSLQSLRQHAHGTVAEAIERALRMAGFQGSLEGFDPDRVRLGVGGFDMSLTDWATSGWQRHGLRRPSMPGNLPDWSPDGAGMPNARLEPAAWLDDDTLDALQLVAYEGGAQGTTNADAALTAQLQDTALRRAICGELEYFAESNGLADAYIDHLRALPGSAGGRAFTDALANQLRARTGWMIETARQDGSLDATTHAALKAAHVQLEPDGSRPSTLREVTLKGHTLVGLHAIRSSAGTFVFLPNTADGDQLLSEHAFAAWLRNPEAEAYIRAHTPFRYHEDIAETFEHTSASRAMPVGFAATRGPQAAAAALIAARIDDVDEMTVSQLERFAETLTMVGAFSVGAVCSLTTGGAGAALCVAGTMGLVADSLRRAVSDFERGNDIDGILNLGEGLLDAIDIGQVAAMAPLMFRLGRQGLRSPVEAMDAVVQAQGQLRAFAADGTVNGALALPRASQDKAPMLSRQLPGGGTVYLQGGREYLERNGDFVGTYLDSNRVRRLRDPHGGDAAGAPVHFKDGQWRRMDRAPAVRSGTTPLPVAEKPAWIKAVPEAEVLPLAKLDELEAVFGFITLKQRPDTDLVQTVRELTMKARVQQICDAPETLGLPGDEAVILRAWADTPALGNQRGVETYSEDFGGDWTRGARFGTGPVGLRIRTHDARTLPTLDAILEAADQEALIERLGLAEDASAEDLMATVRRELGCTIAAAPAQSLQTWQRWAAAQHHLPAAADNLFKHYPELTRAEAEALVNGDRQLKQYAESWLFPERTAAKVADVLGNRSRRRQREAVVDNRIRSLSEAQELGGHLQEVLPGRVWTITADGDTEAAMLVFRRQSQDDVIGQLAFGADGKPYIPGAPTDGSGVKSWQDGVFAQLTAAERRSLSDPDALRRAVVNHMKQTPLMRACALPRVAGGRVRRGVDECSPPAGVSLSREEVATRDAVNERLHDLHQSAEKDYAGIRGLLAESEALKAEKRALQAQGQVLPDAKLARLAELGGMDLMHERNFRLKNFVAYELQDLRFNGKALPLQDFPLQGAAYSGPSVTWMPESRYVGNTPMRRVLVPDDKVEKSYKGKGKQRTETPIPPTDMFRSDYAMGADLLATSSERARSSGAVVLTEDDLRARAGTPDDNGVRAWVRLADLDDAALQALPRSALTEPMQKLLGDAQLLPSNLRELKPGPHRVFEIRSCSEGKVIDQWFNSMTRAEPALATSLRAAETTPVLGITGMLTLISDMHPCQSSCQRRATQLKMALPEVETQVFYHFLDNPERTAWWINLMASREVERTRAELEATGEGLDAAHERIRAMLLDKANPQYREAAEAEMLRNPARVKELPVPRLWLPTAVEEEGF